MQTTYLSRYNVFLISMYMLYIYFFFFFFFNYTATTEIYTLSLHDALPISLTNIPIGCASWWKPSMNFLMFIEDRKSTRLNSSHSSISYAVFCLKKKKKKIQIKIIKINNIQRKSKNHYQAYSACSYLFI